MDGKMMSDGASDRLRQRRAIFGGRLAEEAVEGAVEVRERLEAGLERDLADETFGFRSSPLAFSMRTRLR